MSHAPKVHEKNLGALSCNGFRWYPGFPRAEKNQKGQVPCSFCDRNRESLKFLTGLKTPARDVGARRLLCACVVANEYHHFSQQIRAEFFIQCAGPMHIQC